MEKTPIPIFVDYPQSLTPYKKHTKEQWEQFLKTVKKLKSISNEYNIKSTIPSLEKINGKKTLICIKKGTQ